MLSNVIQIVTSWKSHVMLKRKDLIVYHGCFQNEGHSCIWLQMQMLDFLYIFFEAVINSLLLSQPVLYRSNTENKLQLEGMLEVSVQ